MNLWWKKGINKRWKQLKEADVDRDYKSRMLRFIGLEYVMDNAYLAMCVGAIVGSIICYFVKVNNKLTIGLMTAIIVISMAIAYFIAIKIADYIIIDKYIYNLLRDEL
ncbi:MAG: hypothetical protein RSG48_06750 [Clostridia bacterium]